MWNSRKYTAMAVLGAGLAVAAATPSSAQSWGGAYGYAGGCGASGYAPTAYAGVYSYGWPYGVIGDVGCPAYGYAGGFGYGAYGYAGDYGPYGSTPLYGFAGACRARRNHGHGGYVEARGIAPNDSMSRHVVSAKQAAYLDR